MKNTARFIERKKKNDKHKIYGSMGRYCVLCGENGSCEGSFLEELFDYWDGLFKWTIPKENVTQNVTHLFVGENQICNYCIEDLYIYIKLDD